MPRYLDRWLDGTLLGKKDLDKVSQASQEADRVKKLMGALRYLYRNSPSVNHSFAYALLFHF